MAIFPGGPQDGVQYTMTAPDGSRAVFNDPTDPDYVGMAAFSGLDSPDIREAIDPRSGTDGAVQGLNFRGSRPVVGTVEILAASTTDRNQKFQKLKRACNALRSDGTLDFTPDGGVASRVYFRLNGPVRRADARGWLYSVQFPLMAADPNIYSQTLHSATVGVTPWQTTLTNQGDGEAPLTVDVTVPSTAAVTVLNATTGLAVVLNSYNPATTFGAYSLTFDRLATPPPAVSPYGMAVDASGNVFVSELVRNRIVKYNSSGVFLSTFGSAGNTNGLLNQPAGIAIDGAGKIWVADKGNNRIQRFSAAGVYETQFGSSGTGNGQFSAPQDIAIDGAGNIFVVDRGNDRIQKLAPGTPPTYTSQFGSLGTGNNNFDDPYGIVVDSGGTNLWVTDIQNIRIKKVTNASPPVFVSHIAVPPLGVWLARPQGITRDSANNLYVADASNNRVMKYNSSGALQSTFGTYGTGNSQFDSPQVVAMLGSTTSPLYVGDYSNGRVQKISTGSGVLNLDFANAAVTSAGLNQYGLVNVPDTTWWSLVPGDNVIRVTGGSSWTANWRDAWL